MRTPAAAADARFPSTQLDAGFPLLTMTLRDTTISLQVCLDRIAQLDRDADIPESVVKT